MSKFLWTFLLILILLLGYTTYKLSTNIAYLKPISDSPQIGNLERFNFQNWQEFTAPGEKFRVLLPTLPQHAVDKVKSASENLERKYDMYVAEKSDGSVFMINLITFLNPQESKDPEKLLRSMMEDMLASNKDNQLIQMNATQYLNHPALDYSYENKDTRVDAKTFVDKQTLYMLSRVVKRSNYNKEEFDFFVNSFELVNNQ